VTAPEIKYVDVGTKLYVTPNVKRDGQISMKVRPEVSTSKVETFQSNRIPIVTSTEAETTVLVKSGTTLIIGGLIENKDTSTDSRLPLLGDLPLIGRAFRGTSETKQKTELVVFLTPQIVLPDGMPVSVPPGGSPIPGGFTPALLLQDPVPPSYRTLIRRHLQAHLGSQFRAASLQQGSVVVSFVLSHDGRLVGEGEISSPQGEPFIKAAKTALSGAEPFPPFPEGSLSSEVRFRLAVDYAP
jgi:hypothetical protein